MKKIYSTPPRVVIDELLVEQGIAASFSNQTINPASEDDWGTLNE